MKKNQFLLFYPGPVNVADNVKKIILDYDIGHREKEFSNLLKEINFKLLQLVKIKDISKYQSLFFTTSSSGANESVLLTLAANKKKILILRNGEFSDRLYEIAKIYSNQIFSLNFGWAKKFDFNKIKDFIKKKKVEVVVMVHHETSTGMLNSVEEIRKLKSQYNFILFVDAVSSIGAENIEMEKWQIDFLSGTTTKAIGAFPGSAFVVGKKERFEELDDNNIKNFYFNLCRYYRYMKDYGQTPNTPAVFSALSLSKALDNIFKIGIDNYYNLIKKRAQKLRNFFKKIEVKFLIPEEEMSSVLTTVYPPKGFTVKEIVEKLRKNMIIVYSGKGPYKDKLFQVANIGDLTERDIDYFIKVFRTICKK